MKSQGTGKDISLLARSLGWAALGLGVAQLLAPRRVSRLIGIKPSCFGNWLMRTMGAREIASGLGILRRPDSQKQWLQMRVIGDALDIALLARATMGKMGRSTRVRVGSGLAAVAGITALDVLALRRCSTEPRAEKQRGVHPTATASITIGRTPAEVYAFWRDVPNLQRFVPYLLSVTSLDRIHSHWKARLPAGATVEWDAAIVDDRPGQRIAWKVSPTVLWSMFDNGEVQFVPAPGGQGTEVRLTLWGSQLWAPNVLAKWLRKLPDKFWSTQLRRLKQLLEVGEISQSDASVVEGRQPARPSQSSHTSIEPLVRPKALSTLRGAV